MPEGISNSTNIARFNFVEIREVTPGAEGDRLNGLLKAGWILIDTYVSERYSPHECMIYCIGWPEAKGEPQEATISPETERILRSFITLEED